MNAPTLRIALLLVALAAGAAHAQPGPVVVTPYAAGLAAPVDVVNAGDGSGRLFVVEQAGRIRVVRDGQTLPTPFLDIVPLVQSGGEEGLLGLAFDPQYASNGRFYVYYTAPVTPDNGGNDIVVARYTRSATDPDRADPASRAVVLTIPHPGAGNHNGGKIAFGPDGLLHIAVGDGGGAGDPANAAQNLADLRGKLLRIDVSALPYAIPSSNPFVATPSARGEILAYGLRNPWRFSFDRENGDLFIGDVGQGAWEEIDHVPAAQIGGQNFGWRVFEGTHCFNPSTGCALANHVPPILEYGHNNVDGGFSVTGGYRYRGRAFPELRGYYVYADFVTGRTWAAQPAGGGTWTTSVIASLPGPSAFGEDEAGELYVADLGGGMLRRFGPPDADADGMSDAFETQHFGSATAGNAAADDDGDALPNLQEYREGRDPLAKDHDIFADARLFAMQQYRDFLGREGDAPGVEFWTRQLATGGQTRTQMVETFFNSPEFQATGAPVVRLYFAYFLRIPDYDGLNFWIGQFRAGSSLDAISQQFAQSPEFANRYGALSNAQFVNQVYVNVLGRNADAGGLAFWTARLDSGAMTRGQVMTAFSESAEYRPAIGNEVYVTMIYVGMLRRAPDPGGFDFWVGSMDAGQSGQGLIGQFIAAPEYRNRFLP